MLYVIPWYIAPSYIGTWLCFRWQRSSSNTQNVTTLFIINIFYAENEFMPFRFDALQTGFLQSFGTEQNMAFVWNLFVA